ncbi:hypothetical protein [Methylobacterium sp. CM6257]
MNEPAQRKRGRPPKPADERKGHNLTFRTRADFRDRLEQAAAQSGRSVTEEVELRVERSFEIDRIIRGYNDLMSVFIENGENARKLATSLMAVVSIVQDQKSKDGRQIGSENWLNSPATRAGVRLGAISLIEHYAPAIDDEELSRLDAETRSDIARAETIAKLQVMMATGRASEMLDLVAHQNDTLT